MSIKRGKDKDDVVCMYNGILLSHGKNEMPLTATWINLQMVILSEVGGRQTSQVNDSTYYMWNLKNNGTNELIYNTEIKSEI